MPAFVTQRRVPAGSSKKPEKIPCPGLRAGPSPKSSLSPSRFKTAFTPGKQNRPLGSEENRKVPFWIV